MLKCALLLIVATLPSMAAVNPASSWKLVWSDEFNGLSHAPPDASKWVYDLGAGGWGNRELETYTDSGQNVYQDGKGHLVICARREPGGRYTSTRMKTEGKFTVRYGKVEVRMKIPRGQGIWPAFWMLGDDIETAKWPQSGEIDIMENIGKEPTVVHGTIHGPGYSGAHAIGNAYSLPGDPVLADDFHVYGITWTADAILFAVDDHVYATMTPASLPKDARWVYDHPFFMLLNVAVGGEWPGNPDPAAKFPKELLVDWVRVSKPSQ